LQDPTEKHFGDAGNPDKYEDNNCNNNNNPVYAPVGSAYIVIIWNSNSNKGLISKGRLFGDTLYSNERKINNIHTTIVLYDKNSLV
jgi:hypothetical protein